MQYLEEHVDIFDHKKLHCPPINLFPQITNLASI